MGITGKLSRRPVRLPRAVRTNVSPTFRGYTLLELLVVMGLLAAFSFALLGSTNGQPAALATGQAAIANVVVAARSLALSTGKSSRILVQVDATVTADPARYLRWLVVQGFEAGTWVTKTEACLPGGVYVVPGNFSSLPAGLISLEESSRWVKSDGSTLRSTAMRANQLVSLAVGSPVAETWAAINFSATAATAQSGDLILVTGRLRAPGTYQPGESPVSLGNPDSVRGLSLSAYGLSRLINTRSGF